MIMEAFVVLFWVHLHFGPCLNGRIILQLIVSREIRQAMPRAKKKSKIYTIRRTSDATQCRGTILAQTTFFE